nr:Uncharacterised protein [Streptococcus thermophilus]
MFIIAVALGNFVAPPVIGAMKLIDNGTYSLTWDDGSKDTFDVSGPRKSARITGDGIDAEISRVSGETNHGQVIFFPWEPDRRSYDIYDGTRVDYIGPGTAHGMRTLRFSGDGRTYEIERRTGTLIDATNGPTRLSPDTRTHKVAEAKSKVRVLWWLQLLAVVARFVALAAAVTGMVLLVRRG